MSKPIPPEIIALMGTEENARALLDAVGANAEKVADAILDEISKPETLAAICMALLLRTGWTVMPKPPNPALRGVWVIKEGLPFGRPLRDAVGDEIEAAFAAMLAAEKARRLTP